MIKRLLSSDLFAHRYYAFGLGVQKGTRFLIAPLVIWAFGSQTYANYVLTFAAAQLVAMLMSLGTTNSLVVFWYQQPDKNVFVRSLALLILGIGCAAAIPIGAALVCLPILPPHVLPPLIWAALIVGYAAIYNWNSVGLSLVRVTERSRSYFFAVIATTALLLILVASISHVSRNLVVLVCLYMTVLAIQSALFISSSGISIRGISTIADYKGFSKHVFSYSLPIVGYTLVSLTVITVDKWVVKFYYTVEQFTQYVLNFQFAFAANIVSVVIGMYLLPSLCELVEAENMAALRRKVYTNYVLSLFGTSAIGFAMYVYAWGTNVRLTGPYWLLVLAFGFANMFTISVNVFEAFRDSAGLARIAIIPTVMFWVGFMLAAHAHEIVWNYLMFVIYYIVLFAGSVGKENRRRGATKSAH